MGFKLKSGNKPAFKMMGAVANPAMNPMAQPGMMQPTVPLQKTYKEAWADMSAADQAKHGDYDSFRKAASDYNQKKYGTDDPTKEAAKTGVDKEQVASRHQAKQAAKDANDGKDTSYSVERPRSDAQVQADKDKQAELDAKAKKNQADKAAVAEKRKGQTKGQARRDVKKSEEYKATKGTGKEGREARRNMKSEAEAMSGEAYGQSRRDIKKAQKQGNDKKDARRTTQETDSAGNVTTTKRDRKGRVKKVTKRNAEGVNVARPERIRRKDRT